MTTLDKRALELAGQLSQPDLLDLTQVERMTLAHKLHILETSIQKALVQLKKAKR